MPAAVLVKDDASGEHFELFEQRETAREVSFALGLHELVRRFEQGDHQRLFHAARADDRRAHAVDARIKEVETEMHLVKRIAALDLLHDGDGILRHGGDMVACLLYTSDAADE